MSHKSFMHWIEAYNHDFQRVLTKWYNSVRNSKLALVLRLPNGTSLHTEMSKTYTFFLTTLNNVGSTTLFNSVFINPEEVVPFLLCIIFSLNYSLLFQRSKDWRQQIITIVNDFEIESKYHCKIVVLLF